MLLQSQRSELRHWTPEPNIASSILIKVFFNDAFASLQDSISCSYASFSKIMVIIDVYTFSKMLSLYMVSTGQLNKTFLHYGESNCAQVDSPQSTYFIGSCYLDYIFFILLMPSKLGSKDGSVVWELKFCLLIGVLPKDVGSCFRWLLTKIKS